MLRFFSIAANVGLVSAGALHSAPRGGAPANRDGGRSACNVRYALPMVSRFSESKLLCIGDCRFDPRSHELWRDGVCTRLPRRLSQLLLRLAQAAPEVVTRQMLIDEVWQRRMVEDDVLSRAVAELRKALGDDSKTPRYIETIPKSGYRLCATVTNDKSAEPALAFDANEQSAADPATQRASAPSASLQRFSPWGIQIGLVLLALIALVALGFYLSGSSKDTALTTADMSRVRPLTSGPGWEYRPDISADGQWVAYAESEIDGRTSRLVLQDIAGLHRETLEASAGFNLRPAFAVDGKQVAFLHMNLDRCELRLRSIPGAAGRKLVDCSLTVASTPAWSADQSHIAFTASASAGHAPGLSLVSVQTGDVQSLTEPNLAQGPDRDPEFVPGQNAITFARGFDGEQHLLKLDLTAKRAAPTELFDAGRLQGHAWSSDGSQLVVATDQPGYRTLVLFDAWGKQIDVLSARGARYPAFAANGELVFESAQYDANIWRLSLRDSEAKPIQVIASTRYDSSPTLSADDARLAFVSTRNDFEQIFIANVDGSAVQRLPMPDGQRWSRPTFSPDGAQVLATGYDERNHHWIYRHDIASGRNEQLRTLGEDASGGRYTADGRAIIFMRRTPNGGRDLWRVSTDAGATPAAIAGGDGADQFSLDEDQIVFSRMTLPGFVLLQLNGKSAPREILHEVRPITGFAWALRGRHLYAVVRDQNANVLRRWDLDSGLGMTLARDVDADAVGASLAVSRDGQTIWFARTDSVDIDLMRLPALGR